MELIFKILNFFTHWASKRTLLIGFLISVVSFFIIPETIFPIQFKLIFLTVVYFSFTCIWFLFTRNFYIYKLFPFFKKNKKIVVLSFKVEEEARKDYDRVVRELKTLITTFDLKENIILYNISSEIIRDDDDARKFVNDDLADLLIWGETKSGKVNNEEQTVFEINHTLRINKNLNLNFQKVINDLIFILKYKEFKIKKANDLVDYKVSSSDLLEVFLFLMGLFYLDENNFTEAQKVLNKTKLLIKQKASQSNGAKEILNLITGINNEIVCLTALEAHMENKYDEVERILKNIEGDNFDKINFYTILARNCYLKDDIENALIYTSKISEIDSTHPVIDLNNGFLQIVLKNYQLSVEHYEKLLKAKSVSMDIGPVIEFLHSEYKKLKDPAIFFAIGIMYLFVNYNQAKKHFVTFLQKTNKLEKDYGKMRSIALTYTFKSKKK